jgi:penicillin-binding protein 2
MGIDRMDKYLPLFGLGSKTGIDLSQENSGLLPSKAWKAKRFAKDAYQKNWLPADSVTMGIGQGFNHYTPLQMAYATTILANNGIVRKPHFLSKVLNKDGSTVFTYSSAESKIPISQADLDLVKLGMQQVMKFGTGAKVGAGARYTIAGKTGTAQVVALQQDSRKSKFSGDKYKDHAWFIAFAPVDHPKIAIAVIVENAGFGAAYAGPIVRQLFDAYLLKSESSESMPIRNNYKKFKPEKATENSMNDDEDSVTDDSNSQEEEGGTDGNQ